MHPQQSTTPTLGDTCATKDRATPLFPPRDADHETYRRWLAHAAWPEVVFGARLPQPAATS